MDEFIGSLMSASSKSNDINSSNINETVSPDDVTGLLMRSFNEADENAEASADSEENDNDVDWGLSDDSDDESETDNADKEEQDDSSEANDDFEEDNNEEDTDSEEDSEEEENSEDNGDDNSEESELLGTYESIKDEIDAERETLSEIYERFFKEIVEPLFRKLEDSNINVAFDTTKLKLEGLIRIELSHRNSDAVAEMEINIFANTVNGEFLGMENSDGEAVSTALDDVSLDDLLNILIKVLG